MKTAIVQLDAFDNVISIREKIAWCKTQRVLLVWPNKGKIKLDSMDILLILRSAESLGAQISVVTDEPVIVNQLRGLGISIFSSIPEAQKKPWRKPKIRNQSLFIKKSEIGPDLTELENNRQIKNLAISKSVQWIIFLIGVLATILIVLIFFPSAEITLSPKIETQILQVNFRSDPTIKEINITGAIPFQLVEIEIEGQLEGESSGIIRIPDRKASGSVTFRNLSNQELIIPSGTIVRTNEDPFIRFETTKEGFLPPGIESQIDVPILSTIGGTNGNVPAGRINLIENDLGGNMVVVNQFATSGGVDIKTLAPTENDFETLKKELLKVIITNSIADFHEKNPQAFLISEESIQIKEIISEEKIPEVGAPAERYILRITALLTGWMIEMDEIEESVKLAMDSDSSDDYWPLKEKIAIELIDNSLKFDGSELSWSVKASREITAKIDENQLVQDILGKQNEAAKSIIEDHINLRNEPLIEISPSFWRYMPFLSFRVNVVINEN